MMDSKSTNFQKFKKNTSDKATILQFHQETVKRQYFQMQKTVLNYLENKQRYELKKGRSISLVLYKMMDAESTNFQKFEKNTSDKATILQF